jgi:DNA-binding NarL/FixJ family response regulator
MSGRAGEEAEPVEAHRAVVVDELALARAGITTVLRGLGLDVVAETHAAREIPTLARMERIDLIVVGTPADLDVGDAVRRTNQLRPRPVIVALLPPAREDLVGYFVALGVGAIALRTGTVDELAAAVEAAAKGTQYVAPSLLGALAGSLRPQLPADGQDRLSAREREVLAFLAEGRSNREIAAAMSVTLATVKSHLVHVYAKLGARNRNEALGRALALGLLA